MLAALRRKLVSELSTGPNQPDLIRAERQVLQALCQGTPQGSVRATAQHLLQAYRWRNPIHRVVYEVLMTIPTEAPDLIRDQLPSRLTRRGFPDVDWEDIFRPHSLTKDAAERLMQELIRSSESAPRNVA